MSTSKALQWIPTFADDDTCELAPGERVRLPDGDEGVVVKQTGPDVFVVHPGREIGCGPWIWPRHQVVREAR